MAAIPRTKSLHRQVRQVSESMSGVVWDHAAKSADSGYHLVFCASKFAAKCIEANTWGPSKLSNQIIGDHWGFQHISTIDISC